VARRLGALVRNAPPPSPTPPPKKEDYAIGGKFWREILWVSFIITAANIAYRRVTGDHPDDVKPSPPLLPPLLPS